MSFLPGTFADTNTPSLYDQVIVDIKDYVFHYQSFSTKAWACARTAVLDALGCAIESLYSSPECRHMLGPIVPGSSVPNGFRLPGTAYQLDPVKGAFDLGTLIRYLDHNDALGGAEAGHPSDNLGALISVSDWLSRSTSNSDTYHKGPPLNIRTLLTATIKAYEIQGCFQIRNAFHVRGLDHTILVKLASTAVVSWLLGLGEEQTMAAISHIWMDSSPLRVYRHAPNTIPRKGWAAGDACMRAVQLSLLVRSGQPGAQTVLSASRWGFLATYWNNDTFSLPKVYGTWVVENIFFKLIPAEGHGISAIEAALQQSIRLRSRGLDASCNIRRVKVRTHAAAIRIISKTGDLYNAADRDHCIEYMIAVTLLKGAVPEVKDYNNESLWAKDPCVTALRSKVEIKEDEQFTRDYLDPVTKSAASAISIVLEDGSELEEVAVKYPIGHVENKDTTSHVLAKFRTNMALMFTEQEINGILAAIENEDMPVSLFMDLFVRPRENDSGERKGKDREDGMKSKL
ncbi:MAG: hypothetical protein Q9187_000550 [Circinaria calcarea]